MSDPTFMARLAQAIQRRPALTQERLKELLHYDPETGVFTYRVTRGKFLAGTKAECIGGNGYIQLRVDYKQYTAHRLAWFYVHGRWPRREMDHINLVRSDNRIANLREATSAQNKGNTRARNKCGIKGIRKQNGRWRATIFLNRQCLHLGTFDTPEEANAAYMAAAQAHFGEFARAE